jgi:hypothetical protein
MSKALPSNPSFVGEIKSLIEQSRHKAAVTINATMTMLYWKIGRRVNEEVLQDKRAEYGKRIVATLSQQLVEEYGSSFSEKNLR